MARGDRQQRRGAAQATTVSVAAEPIAAPVALHLASGEWGATAPDADGAPIGGCGSTADEAVAAAEQAAVETATARHPLIPHGYDRRRILCHLGAWGYTDDGHRRESWSHGEYGWFQPHVYESVPQATEAT